MTTRDTRSAARIARTCACLLAALAWATATVADEAVDRAAQMKAAYVFNFLKFVEWETDGSPGALEVCFGGAAEVRQAFATATADKTIGGRRILVRAIESQESPEHCEAVFLDRASAKGPDLPLLTLTIGESPEFTRTGGIIGLYTESNRLRFTINIGNAKRANVQISSNLLKLASSVEQEAMP